MDAVPDELRGLGLPDGAGSGHYRNVSQLKERLDELGDQASKAIKPAWQVFSDSPYIADWNRCVLPALRSYFWIDDDNSKGPSEGRPDRSQTQLAQLQFGAGNWSSLLREAEQKLAGLKTLSLVPDGSAQKFHILVHDCQIDSTTCCHHLRRFPED